MSNAPIKYLPLVNPNVHKSIFEKDSINVQSNTQYNRTLLSVREERDQVLTGNDISKLTSPGKYNLTENDSELSGSNTSHLFKNLYGETLLTFLFFSKDNINNLQNLIKYLVFKNINQVISNQSDTELMIVMRSMFLSFSEHPALIDDTMPQAQKIALMKQYTLEVDRLNQLVLNDVVPRIVSGVQQYVDYLHDASSPRTLMEKPKSDSRAGTRQLRSVTSILTGSVL
jgi:hypothetical protein